MARLLGLIGLLVFPVDRSAGETQPATSERLGPPWTHPLKLRALDGDTLELSDGSRLRLVGVDTPERGRPGAERATRATRALVAQGRWRLQPASPSQDAYGRWLGGLVDERGRNLGALLVAAGHGWIYRDDDPQRRASQAAAVDARRGVHSVVVQPSKPYLMSGASFHAASCSLVRDRGAQLPRAARSDAAFRSGRAPCRRCLRWPPLRGLSAGELDR